MSLGEAKSEVHFDDLCKELNISVDEIEEFIIEGTVFYHCILSCFLKVKWCPCLFGFWTSEVMLKSVHVMV